ncbi:MAG: MOSC domain-containing protein [Cyanobacteria bacterium J06635_10]
MPHIAKICIYPIKSLDGVEVTQAKVSQSGALEYDKPTAWLRDKPTAWLGDKPTAWLRDKPTAWLRDRQFAILDEQGKYVNAKRYGKIHLLRSKFDLENKIVSLQIQGSDIEEIFNLESEKQYLEAWLSDFFGFNVKLQQNLITGFPDDTISPGPTIISTATLREVASWYSDLNEDDIRRRMRTTIEIDGVPAFWEDRLFSETDNGVYFKISNLQFVGVNPTQRCIVPTRNPITGEVNSNFQKIFINQRRETLPEWVNKSRFNHFYKLAVNTRLAEEEVGNKVIQVGDEIVLL